MGTVRYNVLNGRVLSETRNGVQRDYQTDATGNTLALWDNTQTKTDTFDYFAYGKVANRTGTTPTPFQFGGGLGYYQNDSNRTHVRARNFYVNLGKWSSQDPIGFDGGEYNLYRYVQNNPVRWVDPSGLTAHEPFVGLVDFIAAVGVGKEAYMYTCLCGWMDAKHVQGGLYGSEHMADYTAVGLPSNKDIWKSEWNYRFRSSAAAGTIPGLKRPIRGVSSQSKPKGREVNNRNAISVATAITFRTLWKVEEVQASWLLGILPTAWSYEDLPSDWIGTHVFRIAGGKSASPYKSALSKILTACMPATEAESRHLFLTMQGFSPQVKGCGETCNPIPHAFLFDCFLSWKKINLKSCCSVPCSKNFRRPLPSILTKPQFAVDPAIEFLPDIHNVSLPNYDLDVYRYPPPSTFEP